eukprot:3780409-Prymnesium_polylepis.2
MKVGLFSDPLGRASMDLSRSPSPTRAEREQSGRLDCCQKWSIFSNGYGGSLAASAKHNVPPPPVGRERRTGEQHMKEKSAHDGEAHGVGSRRPSLA